MYGSLRFWVQVLTMLPRRTSFTVTSQRPVAAEAVAKPDPRLGVEERLLRPHLGTEHPEAARGG